jgi:1-acyl-sn-glycerol-3-phosphate acyltransferase
MTEDPGLLRRLAAKATGRLIVGATRLLTGVQTAWLGGPPSALPTVYFANHSSHGDFVLVWASLPPDLRETTRPVAGADYWQASGMRRFIGGEVFRALMIPRHAAPSANPHFALDQMSAALLAGDSLILFPEGTRNTGDEVLLAFKSGLFHLAQRCPEVRLVPVWLDNLRRVLPKGSMVPVPLACAVRFGAPLERRADEDKAAFLTRAREALLNLRPEHSREED